MYVRKISCIFDIVIDGNNVMLSPVSKDNTDLSNPALLTIIELTIITYLNNIMSVFISANPLIIAFTAPWGYFESENRIIQTNILFCPSRI